MFKFIYSLDNSNTNNVYSPLIGRNNTQQQSEHSLVLSNILALRARNVKFGGSLRYPSTNPMALNTIDRPLKGILQTPKHRNLSSLDNSINGLTPKSTEKMENDTVVNINFHGKCLTMLLKKILHLLQIKICCFNAQLFFIQKNL